MEWEILVKTGGNRVGCSFIASWVGYLDKYTDKRKGREARVTRDREESSRGLGRKIVRREWPHL